jgi:hypothetical protein
MIAPSATTMMAPQVYLLHSVSHTQLQTTQPPSTSSPIQNGTEVTAEGRVGVGSEIPLGASQQ